MYARELEIQDMMSRGIPRQTIFKNISEKWNISERTVEGQYNQIVNAIQSVVDEGRAELRARLLAQSNLVYREALATGKYKIALDATIAEGRIGGVFDKEAGEDAKLPEIIEVAEGDFSGPRLVGEVAENE